MRYTLFAAVIGLAATVFVGTANAVLIDFESIGGSPDYNLELGCSYTEDGFDFAPAPTWYSLLLQYLYGFVGSVLPNNSHRRRGGQREQMRVELQDGLRQQARSFPPPLSCHAIACSIKKGARLKESEPTRCSELRKYAGIRALRNYRHN